MNRVRSGDKWVFTLPSKIGEKVVDIANKLGDTPEEVIIHILDEHLPQYLKSRADTAIARKLAQIEDIELEIQRLREVRDA